MPSHPSAVFVEQRFKKMKDIHPFAQLLNHEDLDDCDWLEHAAFDPVEAASREKVSNCASQLRATSIFELGFK
jgi:hypothetical protein